MINKRSLFQPLLSYGNIRIHHKCEGGIEKSAPGMPPQVLGIWGEWLFIFRELGSTGNYLRGAREQAHNFGDLGSLAKKQKR